MGAFKQFMEQQEFVEFVQQSFSSPQPEGGKTWSATKDEIMAMWKNLRPNTPIYLTPMMKKPGGGSHSYGEDGIRITGSAQFITSVLSRLKELIGHENPNTKLRLVFRGVDKNKGRPDRMSYVFYLNLETRGKGRAGRPSQQKGNQ